MKYLLHIDTSAATGTVAVSGDGQLIASRTNTEARNHAAAINDMAAGALADAGLNLGSIDAFVVCAGPGSYTGLRIGMATAKGYCYALDKPLLLDNKLTLLAYQHYKAADGQYGSFLPILLARTGEYFVAKYNKKFNCELIPQLMLADELKQLAAADKDMQIITDINEEAIAALNIHALPTNFDTNIDLKWWSNYSFEQYICNNTVNLSLAEPFYLKQVYTHK